VEHVVVQQPRQAVHRQGDLGTVDADDKGVLVVEDRRAAFVGADERPAEPRDLQNRGVVHVQRDVAHLDLHVYRFVLSCGGVGERQPDEKGDEPAHQHLLQSRYAWVRAHQ
jgi:hypothetical protein